MLAWSIAGSVVPSFRKGHVQQRVAVVSCAAREQSGFEHVWASRLRSDGDAQSLTGLLPSRHGACGACPPDFNTLPPEILRQSEKSCRMQKVRAAHIKARVHTPPK